MRKSVFLRKGSIILLFLFGIALSFVSAQERTVTGKVTSQEEGPLPGVNILIQGTMQGTVTDANGNYSIKVPGPDAVLVFSSVGYTKRSVTVGNQTKIDVVLVPEVTSLNEVVVTAYATQQKKDITGSVGVVKAEELVQMPQASVTQQLQGRVSGVVVTQDSRAGQPAKVRIRGFGSFQNNSPLYIVDGVPTTDVNSLNPDDIESMTVLKDAGAASIYGARASNGVILVTTKKGSEGIKVDFNMYTGTQDPGKGPQNLLNTQEYANLQWLVYHNDGTDETHPFYGPSTNPSPTLPSWAADTKWWDEVTQTAPIQNYNLSMSGGNKKARYFAGVGYFDQTGTIITNWYKRYSVRFNSDFNIKDRVTIGENLNVTHQSDHGIDGNGSENTGLMMGVYRMQPIVPVKWHGDPFVGLSHTFREGDWGGTGIAPRLGNAHNWVADATRAKDNRWQNIRLLGNIYADVKILEGLNFKSSFGGSLSNWYWTSWNGKTYENSENVGTSSYSEGSGYGGEWTWTNTLTFNRKLGDHNILAVAGYEAVKTGIGRDVSAQRAGYFSNAFSFRTVSNGASLVAGNSSFYTPRTLVSQFLRADYNYQSKYYLSATVRRDGSSVFGSDNRYGIFPSVSAAWRISDESFFSGVEFLNDLKIRGGYGTLGNQLPVSPANQFYLYGASPSQSFYDINGTTNSSVQGFRPTRIGNPNAKWETSVIANVGFDATLLDRKFELNLDWYTKENRDLLFNPELPGTSGAADRPYVNVGEMKNHGIDLTLTYRQVFNDFRIEASGQFTTYKNQIVKIAEGYEYFDDNSYSTRIGAFNRNMVGHEVSEFFGYQVVGLFQDDAEVSSAPTQDGAEPGFFRFEDNNGVDAEGNLTGEPDGEITPADRTFIGNPNPDFTYGLNLVLGYKGFDLTAFFYGSQGNEIYNYNKWWLDFWPSFQGQKSKDLLYNSWTTENTSATVPKASNTSNFSTNTVSNSYYIEDGSFFRMKSLQIGYTFPKSFAKNVFSSLRIYVQGTNLFTITKYSGLDPELAGLGDTSFGIDEGNLPVVKQFLFGLKVGF
ncbi:MAG: TonB-dependent receptor [Bacteroidales bacterium]|nr:TonB-dependent receptor [Bacteroidales bacterium]